MVDEGAPLVLLAVVEEPRPDDDIGEPVAVHVAGPHHVAAKVGDGLIGCAIHTNDRVSPEAEPPYTKARPSSISITSLVPLRR